MTTETAETSKIPPSTAVTEQATATHVGVARFLTDEELAQKYFNLGFLELGACMTTLGNVMQQGPKVGNNGALGGVAIGLERCAAYFRGQSFAPITPEQRKLLSSQALIVQILQKVQRQAQVGQDEDFCNVVERVLKEISGKKSGS